MDLEPPASWLRASSGEPLPASGGEDPEIQNQRLASSAFEASLFLSSLKVEGVSAGAQRGFEAEKERLRAFLHPQENRGRGCGLEQTSFVLLSEEIRELVARTGFEPVLPA